MIYSPNNLFCYYLNETLVTVSCRDFLESSSKFEVNLDRQVLQTTLDAMKTPSRYCMDKAQQHIYNLMKVDCYPRFLKSDTYRDLLLEFTDKRR